MYVQSPCASVLGFNAGLVRAAAEFPAVHADPEVGALDTK